MKKFFGITFLVLILLGSIFAYVLYTEGAFDKKEVIDENAKPFSAMKCEAGKCGGNKKCGE